MCVSLSGGGYKCFLTSNSSPRDLFSGGPANVHKVFLCVFRKLREETLNFKLVLISPAEARGAGDAFNGYSHTYCTRILVK